MDLLINLSHYVIKMHPLSSFLSPAEGKQLEEPQCNV